MKTSGETGGGGGGELERWVRCESSSEGGFPNVRACKRSPSPPSPSPSVSLLLLSLATSLWRWALWGAGLVELRWVGGGWWGGG